MPLAVARKPPQEIIKATKTAKKRELPIATGYYGLGEEVKPKKPAATRVKKPALSSGVGEIPPGDFLSVQGGVPKVKKAGTGKKSAKATAAASSAMGAGNSQPTGMYQNQMGMQFQAPGFQMMVQMMSNQVNMQGNGGCVPKAPKVRKIKD